MIHAAVYMKNSDHQWLASDSDDESLPQYLCGPLQESHRDEFQVPSSKNHFANQTDMISKDATSQESLRPIMKETSISDEENKAQDTDQEAKNPFWISVSGYKYERSNVVYRFFSDIGHIVGKCFTETNLMYLKYFSMLDCQIALSYNGQKIGYGCDISVKVKPENPVTEGAIIESLEQCSDGHCKATGTESTSTTTLTIDVEENEVRNEISPHELEIGQKKDLGITHKRVSVLQWFKQKLSYMFYFY